MSANQAGDIEILPVPAGAALKHKGMVAGLQFCQRELVVIGLQGAAIAVVGIWHRGGGWSGFHGSGGDFLADFRAVFAAGDFKVVVDLDVQPEVCRGAEIARQAEG